MAGGLASTDYDDLTARIWDVATGREIRRLNVRGRDVNAVCYHPDGRRSATVDADYTAKLWDVDTGQNVLTLPGHTGPLICVCFSPDGQRLATGGWDRTIKIWEAPRRQRRNERTGEGCRQTYRSGGVPDH